MGGMNAPGVISIGPSVSGNTNYGASMSPVLWKVGKASVSGTFSGILLELLVSETTTGSENAFLEWEGSWMLLRILCPCMTAWMFL